ncbi:hypothetical protein D9758_008136 [Tetrapyrgos nigripes]|uniref:Uncharacterized protein n=1 Tax=Tetrapyrgos nigripes TaxID=182062 RepID=A0A8H5GHP3_9AGAR|nr:hypothetical protein D9758_008136 [Tetrapyrgos nigripes]
MCDDDAKTCSLRWSTVSLKVLSTDMGTPPSSTIHAFNRAASWFVIRDSNRKLFTGPSNIQIWQLRHHSAFSENTSLVTNFHFDSTSTKPQFIQGRSHLDFCQHLPAKSRLVS